MYIVTQQIVRYKQGDITYTVAQIECDTISDLPLPTGNEQPGVGSKAHVVADNSTWAYKSTGQWVLQNPDGTAGYTKEEIDQLIQDAEDYADSAVTTGINALDVSSVGGTTRYIYQISQTNGKISASSYASDTIPTEGSTKLVQSNGIKTYVDDECGAIANLGAKNMCPYNTFSAANSSSTPINDQPINLPAGTYILTYKQTATTGASSIRLLNSGVSITNFTINNDSTLTKEKEFTLSSDANQIRVYTSVPNTYSNFMIRRKEIVDSTYVPYGPTNTELNANKITMLNILGAGTRIEATSDNHLNFDDAPFTSVGRFNWLSGSTQYITNCPAYISGSAKGGLLETSFIQGGSTVLQTVYPSAGADSPSIFWQRFRYGAGTTANPYRWTNWFAFTGTEVIPPNAQTNNLMGSMRSVAISTEENDFEPIEEER